MALILDFKIKELPNAMSFQLTDKTGIYSLVNVGGYNTPNPAVSQILTATLDLTFPDSVTLMPTGTPISFSVFNSGVFPNTDNVYTTLLPTNYGVAADTPFVEGVYYMTYVVTGTGFSYTANKYVVVWAQTKCCVTNIGASVSLDCCDCSTSAQKKALRIIFLKHALVDAENCGNLERAIDALQKLQAICNGENCVDC